VGSGGKIPPNGGEGRIVIRIETLHYLRSNHPGSWHASATNFSALVKMNFGYAKLN